MDKGMTIIIAILIVSLAVIGVTGWVFGNFEIGKMKARLNELDLQPGDASGYAELKQKYDDLKKTYDAGEEQLADLKLETYRLKNIVYCTQTGRKYPPIDYTSNATVSEGLKDYILENISGSEITNADWEEYWNDSKTAEHMVSYKNADGEFDYVFIAYFPDDNGPAIFSFNAACFLYYK